MAVRSVTLAQFSRVFPDAWEKYREKRNFLGKNAIENLVI